jgi:gas vesicle protein
MAQAKLVAEVGADITRFEAGMAKLGVVADKAGSKIANRFSERFGSGLLAGAVIAGVTALITAPLRALPERAKEIAEMSQKLMLTTDEFQALEAAANAAHQPIDMFIESITAGNVPLSEAVKKLGEYRSQLHLTAQEIKGINEARTTLGKLSVGMQSAGARGFNFLANLTTAGMATVENLLGIKHNDAAEQSAWEGILGMSGRTGDLEEILKGKKRDRLVPQLAMLAEQQKSVSPSTSSILGQSVTSRQQIGAFIGTTPDVVAEARKTNEKLNEIKEQMRSIETEISGALQ